MGKKLILPIKDRFDASYKEVSNDEAAFLNNLIQEHQLTSKVDLLKKVLEMAMAPTRTTGPRDTTLDAINQVVQRQIEINQTTDKEFSVGTGENRKKCKYEQRTITSKWIMQNVQPGPRFESVQAYFDSHPEIAEHNQWVVESNAYFPKTKDGIESSLEVRVANFNRKTTKNHQKVNQIDYENWANKLNENETEETE